jgi:response regulator RpfG family c-di-GMP phosphodiesterase
MAGLDPFGSGLVPRCLVVDDEPRLRQVLVRLMRADGFVVDEAGNGEEALQAMQANPATLVLSDIQMPGMDGFALLRELRARWPEAAVVMVSGNGDVQVAVSCLAVGAMDYLTKPFHLEEVRARLTQVLERRRLVLENREYQFRLEQKVAAQARRIETQFLGGVQALVEALEAKDPYTRGHSERVSQYAGAIARGLGLDEATVRAVELGGRLHDIGKIGVREDVLTKPARLTREEYEHVMTHMMVGWRILSGLVDDRAELLNIVRHHHERIDGLGLPDALVGDAIPLEARIVAVADSFDAMTSGRRYRDDGGKVLEDALAELERCVGTQFDAACVRAFVAAFRAGDIAILARTDIGRPGATTPISVPAQAA